MTKVQYFTAATLDGLIADEDNPLDWLFEVPHGEDDDDRPCWVFTHRDLPALPGVDIRFTSGPVQPAYDEMVAVAPGKNIWIVGGGDLVGQYDDAGLLDVERQD